MTLNDDYVGFNMMIRALVGYAVNREVTFTAGIIQNPVFDNNLDIYVLGESKLASDSLSATVTIADSATDLNLQSIGTSGRIFAENNYVLRAEGTLDLFIRGKYSGSGFIPNDTTISFNVALAKSDNILNLISLDENFSLLIPENSFEKDQYVLLKNGFNSINLKTIQSNQNYRTYSIISTKKELDNDATVKFYMDPQKVKSKNFQISVFYKDSWELLPTLHDIETGTVSAKTKMLGAFKVESIEQTDIQNKNLKQPDFYSLSQNYPNPFNPSTKISFGIKDAGNVKLIVYNILGQTVRTLINEYMQAKYYEINWDGRNDFGKNAPSGIYIYRLNVNNKILSKKMFLIR